MFEASMANLRFVALVIGRAAALALVVACSGEKALPPADAMYESRGAIRSMPGTGDLPDKIMIHHEPIPSFRNAEGRTVGMESMVMGFTPATTVRLDALAAGDRIAFTFEVRWQADPLLLVTQIRELPGEPALDLSEERH
jgi:Cu/Ag efflux protein CusF